MDEGELAKVNSVYVLLCKGHTEEAKTLLLELRNAGVTAGPSNEREEMSPGHWREPGMTDFRNERLVTANI